MTFTSNFQYLKYVYLYRIDIKKNDYHFHFVFS